MRATVVFPLILCLLAGIARAQAPLEVGSPESAFAGGPIHLTRNQVALLRAHYQGDKVPLVPQPFRGKLDTALLGRDWTRVEAVKKELLAAQGVIPVFAWEQSRFISTGALGVAEMHALDIAATGATAISETAVMLWFYSVAVTMTDGHKCADAATKEAHLDRLRGPVFEPVTRIVRTISDDRLAAMRDLAIRLETVLATDRTDDTMCRIGGGKADVKPDALWRPEAGLTRGMLAKHLVALAAVMRPRPIARPEPPKPVASKAVPAPAKPEAAKIEPVKVEPAKAEPAKIEAPKAEPPRIDPARFNSAIPRPEIIEPILPPPAKPASDSAPTGPTPTGPTTRPVSSPTTPSNETTPTGEPVKAAIPAMEVVDPKSGKPNPTRFEPPSLQLSTPK